MQNFFNEMSWSCKTLYELLKCWPHKQNEMDIHDLINQIFFWGNLRELWSGSGTIHALLLFKCIFHADFLMQIKVIDHESCMKAEKFLFFSFVVELFLGLVALKIQMC